MERLASAESKYQSLKQQTTNFWRERAVFQRSAFGRLTAGNDVVATIFIRIFFFFPPFFFFRFSRFFLRCDLFL